jgi:hypothetical protein
VVGDETGDVADSELVDAVGLVTFDLVEVGEVGLSVIALVGVAAALRISLDRRKRRRW